MVAHQAVVREAPGVFLLGRGQQVDEPLESPFKGKQKEPVIPPGDQVIVASVEQRSGFTRPGASLAWRRQ